MKIKQVVRRRPGIYVVTQLTEKSETVYFKHSENPCHMWRPKYALECCISDINATGLFGFRQMKMSMQLSDSEGVLAIHCVLFRPQMQVCHVPLCVITTTPCASCMVYRQRRPLVFTYEH
jgi:hypothetical protein